MIKDSTKLSILTNQSYDDGDCTCTHPGDIAYYGSVGVQKVVLIDSSTFLMINVASNDDICAIWLLNTQTPLMSQRGTRSVLVVDLGLRRTRFLRGRSPKNFRCKPTLHIAPAGESSDWLQLP